MANRKELRSVIVIGVLTLAIAGGGFCLGFGLPRFLRHVIPAPAPPIPASPLYGMGSIRSAPDRIRLEWREVPEASGYRVTLMTVADDSLFVSPTLSTNAWVIPPEYRSRLKPKTTYHWRLTVFFPAGQSQGSEPAAFATQ